MVEPATMRQAVAAHRKAMDRVIDQQGVLALHEEFDVGLTALTRALNRSFQGRGRDEVTGATLSELSLLFTAGLAYLFTNVAGTLAAQTGGVVLESARRVARFVGLMEGKPSRLDAPRQAEMVARLRVGELTRLRQRSMGVAGADAAAVVRARLNILKVGTDTVNTAITEAMEATDSQFWQVERVARTETSRAYNTTQDDGITALARDLPGLHKRWTELVSDITGAPLDNRVGRDSMVLHGQIAPPGGVFTMPAAIMAPVKMVGMTWKFPPNRPNDRAVLMPWKKEWGIPGYFYRDGGIVDIDDVK